MEIVSLKISVWLCVCTNRVFHDKSVIVKVNVLKWVKSVIVKVNVLKG